MTSLHDFDQWLKKPEGLNLEFKAAPEKYGMPHVFDYCAALANEGGGKLVLGVDDADIPSHPYGYVVRSNGNYTFPMRLGESLKEMDDATLRRKYAETEEDFSADIVPSFSIHDLDEKAVTVLKERRARRTGNPDLASQSTEQVLRDLQLLSDGGLPFAALILLGKHEKIVDVLPQAEIIYEWRGYPGKISYDFRKEWTEPYLAVADEIWETMNVRNIRTPYQQGFDVPLVIPAFDENSCREAVNNAVAHRDYRRPGTAIFIRCSPHNFSIVSPGGFPTGVTSENALDRSQWRNMRIAATLQHMGLVERSGQGLNRIFEETIRHGKGIPDFNGTDDYEVRLNIPAQISDPTFVRYLEKVANEQQIQLSFEEILELEHIRTQGKITSPAFRAKFLDLGLIEQHGKTRGAHYILTHRYYTTTDHRGAHTQLAGLSRDARKTLIMQHLQKNGSGNLDEFAEAFPDISRSATSRLLRDLRKTGQICFIGSKRDGHWEMVVKKHKNES